MNKKFLTMLMALAMLVSIVPMAAMAEENGCAHKNVTYVSTTPGYHDMMCVDCEYMYGYGAIFTCKQADKNYDGICDKCRYQYKQPAHTCTFEASVTSNSDGTHNVNCSCGQFVKVDCLDNNGDGKCDSCGYQKYPGHECTFEAGVTSNGDGTHNVNCSCGQFVNVKCLDNNGDGKCDSCGYQKYAPVCKHGFQYVTDNGDGKTHKATCRDCGIVIAEKLEHVFDENGVCACGAIQPNGCDHDGGQKLIDNKDGRTHKVVCEKCGVTIAQKADHDYNAATGKCACGAKKPVNKPVDDPDLDDVPRTGDSAAAIALITMILIGSAGTVLYFRTDRKYF